MKRTLWADASDSDEAIEISSLLVVDLNRRPPVVVEVFGVDTLAELVPKHAPEEPAPSRTSHFVFRRPIWPNSNNIIVNIIVKAPGRPPSVKNVKADAPIKADAPGGRIQSLMVDPTEHWALRTEDVLLNVLKYLDLDEVFRLCSYMSRSWRESLPSAVCQHANNWITAAFYPHLQGEHEQNINEGLPLRDPVPLVPVAKGLDLARDAVLFFPREEAGTKVLANATLTWPVANEEERKAEETGQEDVEKSQGTPPVDSNPVSVQDLVKYFASELGQARRGSSKASGAQRQLAAFAEKEESIHRAKSELKESEAAKEKAQLTADLDAKHAAHLLTITACLSHPGATASATGSEMSKLGCKSRLHHLVGGYAFRDEDTFYLRQKPPNRKKISQQGLSARRGTLPPQSSRP
ncbi:uncharacterized protein EV422DRAFT_615146 [Fimicolochytrium jonesii]|uniref:uncharacterized protein n=1 Tax=Fimicolochytrium jonesii TaxID=1396493 RepID=UPI0022FEC210|nr:uncharacterized protein EV422DRAFT_615146 [Fimicolochytrium jonesii]KAI8821758.1 hypothetical protein EV422DRAFT_615146 [Fimicolochytrium jonesii]